MTLSGCMAVASPAIGLLYTDVHGPVGATSAGGSKEGQSCANSILGLFATGDASIEAAAAAGGVNTISSIDHHTTNLLGIFGTYCTIVRGS